MGIAMKVGMAIAHDSDRLKGASYSKLPAASSQLFLKFGTAIAPKKIITSGSVYQFRRFPIFLICDM
jgi:hypothetical protein